MFKQDIHTLSYSSIGTNNPRILPSGVLMIPTINGGSQVTALIQMGFEHNYGPAQDGEVSFSFYPRISRLLLFSCAKL